MPCVKGRAQHILCRPDCSGEDPCSCKVREAFSAREVCFGDNRDNTQLTLQDARDDICEYLTGEDPAGILRPGSPTTFDDISSLRDYICETNTPPYFNCPFTVTIEGADGPGVSGPTGTVGPFEVAVIDKGACSGGDISTLESGENVVYNVFIDGVQCTNPFTNPTTST